MANVFRSATLAGPLAVSKLSSRMCRATIRNVQRDLLNAVCQLARLTHGIPQRREGRDKRRRCPLAGDALRPVATFGRIGPPPASLVSGSPRDAVGAPIR